jgi:two-component system cell cycle response regulator
MGDITGCKASLDADATLVVPIAEEDRNTESPPETVAHANGSGAPRYDTPLFRAPVPLVGNARATLMVLTGAHAGQLLAIDGAPVTIGRALDADLVVEEAGVSRHHARIAHTAGGGFYVEDLASTNGTFVGASRVGISLLGRGDLLQLGPRLQVRFAVVDAVEESLYRQLYESSVRDPLTRAFNRRYLAERLAAEVGRARRADDDVAILLIDVDSLKKVNDCFGHLAGDRALCSVAARILHALRMEDVLARYGGDEFVVLAAGTSRADAAQLAERVRLAVEGLHMSARGQQVHVTTSIGVASLTEVAGSDDPVATLLSMADARMYGAKASGRNQIQTTDPPREAHSPAAR